MAGRPLRKKNRETPLKADPARNRLMQLTARE